MFSVIFPRREGQTQGAETSSCLSVVSGGTCRRGLVLGAHGFSRCRTPGCMQVGASNYPASVMLP